MCQWGRVQVTHFSKMKGDIKMGRTARKQSVTGYYHVIVRGIGRQILFEDRGDGIFFLKLLAKYSEETNITVLAYCLMENHVHILLHDDKDSRFIMMHNSMESMHAILTKNMIESVICFRTDI